MKCLRKVVSYIRLDSLRTDGIRNNIGSTSRFEHIHTQQKQWFGYLVGMNQNFLPTHIIK